MSNKEDSCPVQGKEDLDACPVKDHVGDEGCPVKCEQVPASTSIFSNTYTLLFGKTQVEGKECGECDGDKGYNPLTNDLKFRNEPHPDQRIPLSKKRTISTIPKAEYTPSHQPENFERWVYPSEQQYFNAMKRKGYEANEEDIGVILAIHNIVNEKGWTQIKDWEEMRGCSRPRLKRFMGRPKDISPKAYIMHFVMGYTLPFDRHDWIVDSNGQEVRYVIDFYTGTPTVSSQTGSTAPVSMHLDVRPALDTPLALFYRMKFGAMEWFNSLNLKGILNEPTSGNGSTGGGKKTAGSSSAARIDAEGGAGNSKN